MKYRRLLSLAGCALLLLATQPLNAGAEPTVTDCVTSLRDDGSKSTLITPKGSIPLTADRSDPHHIVHTSADGAYQVEVWRGDPSPGQATQEDFDELTAASLETITTADEDTVEEIIDFEDLPNPSQISTIATRITTPATHELTFGGREGKTERSNCTAISKAKTGTPDITVTDDSGRSFTFGSPENLEVAPLAASDWNIYIHKAFIPDAQVSTGVLCGTFKGDNRTWNRSNTSAASRTYVSVRGDWANKKLVTTKTVGATHRIAAWGYSAKTATASSAGIKFVAASASATYARVEIVHSVGNPLCSIAGPIQYSEVVQMFKSGTLSVAGSGVQVPSHEMYGIRANAASVTVAQYYRKDMMCLSFNCGKYTINKTVS